MDAKELTRQYYNLIENNYDSLQDLEEFFETYANYKNKELYSKIESFRKYLSNIMINNHNSVKGFIAAEIVSDFNEHFNIEKV